jgi:GDP-L-fucose synthase
MSGEKPMGFGKEFLDYWNGKKVLMTGGTGFVGKNFQHIAPSLGINLTVLGSKECDLTYKSAAINFFRLAPKFDYIFHGAAYQGAGDFTLKYPGAQIQRNSVMHMNVLSSWHQYQPQAKLIGLGSTCSYPGDLPVLHESDYLTGKLHESVQYYGLTKMLMQQGIEAYKDQYKLQGTTVVFATLYGPHDDFDPTRSHVVSALIKKFCDARVNNEPSVEVWGDGTQTRELIYIDDQILGMLMAADYNGPLINIGSGIEVTIKELAETIKRLTGFQGDIVYNTNRFVGVMHKVLNVDLAKELYGWTGEHKLTTLEHGLRKTITWYFRTYHSAWNNRQEEGKI